MKLKYLFTSCLVLSALIVKSAQYEDYETKLELYKKNGTPITVKVPGNLSDVLNGHDYRTDTTKLVLNGDTLVVR